MDQRVIPFDYLRDLGDDDFYVHLNSNDAKSQKLSEFGARTHWRNFLPLTLQLKDGDWEVALTQIMLKNVQHVDKELLIYKGDGTLGVEHRFPLLKSVFTDNLALIDGVAETIRRHDVETLMTDNVPFLSFKVVVTYHGFTTCLIRKYEVPSLDDFAAAALKNSNKLKTSDFMSLMEAVNPTSYKMYKYTFNNEGEANQFVVDNEDFERAGHEHNHATQTYSSFQHVRVQHVMYKWMVGVYKDHRGNQITSGFFNAHVYISNTLLKFLKANPPGVQLRDSKGNAVWRTTGDANPLWHQVDVEADASNLFPFFHFSADPSADTVSYRVARPIAIQAEGKTVLMPFQWNSTLSAFLKNLKSGDPFIESVTPSLFQVHVHDLPFKYPIVADKGEKLQGLIHTLLNAKKKETTVFDQVRGDRVRYFPLENVKVKHLDVKVSNLDGIKEAPTFLTGYTQLTLHFRRNYLDLQRDRPHDGGAQ